MKPDLQGLVIHRVELNSLTGLYTQAADPISLKDLLFLWSGRNAPWHVEYLPLAVAFFVGILHGALVHRWTIPLLLHLPLLGVELFLGLIAAKFVQLTWVKGQMTEALQGLLEEIQRFNAIIKSIDINDQIEAAGNPGTGLQQREKVIEALSLAREDLIRALKTERILRENRQFIQGNPELFESNLTNLTALQVSDMATEHGRLLNEALQVAIGTQAEMRKLQQFARDGEM